MSEPRATAKAIIDLRYGAYVDLDTARHPDEPIHMHADEVEALIVDLAKALEAIQHVPETAWQRRCRLRREQYQRRKDRANIGPVTRSVDR